MCGPRACRRGRALVHNPCDMAYDLRLEGSGEPAGVRLLDDDHELLADVIMRGAGAVRLLRRLVDAGRSARFSREEAVPILHELADLEAGLSEPERSAVAAQLERLRALFERARERGAGVVASVGGE